MRKILIWALVGIVGLGIARWLAWEAWKDYMGQLENNANCRFYSEEEYAQRLRRREEMPVPRPINPFTVRLTLDLSGLPSNPDRLRINAGTAPISPPLYNGEEYIGPFHQTLDLILSDERNEWPFSFSPSISVYYDKEKAICTWASEEGVYIQDSRGHPHFLIELLPYRRMDIMSGYNIKRIE